MKRFAILRWDGREHRTYLVKTVPAESAPHALILAYQQYGNRRDLFTRSTTGKASHKTAPGYSGRDPHPPITLPDR